MTDFSKKTTDELEAYTDRRVKENRVVCKLLDDGKTLEARKIMMLIMGKA